MTTTPAGTRRFANGDWTAGMPDPGPWQKSTRASVELHRRASELVEGIIVSTPRLADVYLGI